MLPLIDLRTCIFPATEAVAMAHVAVVPPPVPLPSPRLELTDAAIFEHYGFFGEFLLRVTLNSIVNLHCSI